MHLYHMLPLSPTISHYLPGTELKRVFKRWQEHRSPSELYNHGFENMESLGAVSGAIERSRWLGANGVDLLRSTAPPSPYPSPNPNRP